MSPVDPPMSGEERERLAALRRAFVRGVQVGVDIERLTRRTCDQLTKRNEICTRRATYLVERPNHRAECYCTQHAQMIGLDRARKSWRVTSLASSASTTTPEATDA